MIPPGCPEKCPGCRFRFLTAAQSDLKKLSWVTNILSAWEDQIEGLRVIPADQDRWGYREKILLHTTFENESWNFGFLKKDELIAAPDCPVHSPRARELIHILCEGLKPPPELFPLRFLSIHARQVGFVLKARELPPDSVWLTGALPERIRAAGVEGLWINLNPAAGHRVFHAKGWHLIRGMPESVSSQGLIYGPSAFEQLIPELAENALYEASDFFGLELGDRVLDFYCGIGFSLRHWERAKVRTWGVELSGEAVELARKNAPQSLILRGRAVDRLGQAEQWLQEGESAGRSFLYLNPPRLGMEERLLKWVTGNQRFDRIAYLSCSMGTLKRDLAGLEEGGYRIRRIIPYDFFPQTHHVEALVLLE